MKRTLKFLKNFSVSSLHIDIVCVCFLMPFCDFTLCVKAHPYLSFGVNILFRMCVRKEVSYRHTLVPPDDPHPLVI